MSYVVSDLGNTIYRFDGSVASIQTGGLLDLNLLNFGSTTPIHGVFRTEGGVLNERTDDTASVSLNGGPWEPLDFIGAGTMQTLKILFIPVLAVPVTVFTIGSEVYLYLPNGPAILSGVSSSFTISNTSSTTLPKGRNVCIASGSRILTEGGERLVESLRLGDRVMTKDHGLRPLIWIGCSAVPVGNQRHWPDLRAVEIAAGAFGHNRPRSLLRVSQQHRILLRHHGCERLASAKHLLGLSGIRLAQPLARLRYFHLLFNAHELIRANGLWVESLYLGPEAKSILHPIDRLRIEKRLPGPPLIDRPSPPPARPFMTRADFEAVVN